MPIYEYYCPVCRGHFSHLAKRIGEIPPACPACGNSKVERLISTVGVVRAAAGAENAPSADDPQAIAQTLKKSGWLDQAEGAFRSEAYRELIERRAAGATDADLADLNDSLGAEFAGSAYVQDGVRSIVARRLSEDAGEGHEHHHDHDHDHEHVHPDHDSEHAHDDASHDKPAHGSRRSGRNLGWA